EGVRGDAGPRGEAGPLAVGVHARVGPPRRAHEHALAGHVPDGVLQRRLNRALTGLPLPPREVGAVVLDDDAELAAQNSIIIPSDQVVSPTCRRPARPRPEMSA